MSHPAIQRRAISLVELLVVVAIFSLLAVTVLPSFTTQQEARKLSDAVDTFQNALSSAQAKAIRTDGSRGIVISTTPVSYDERSPAVPGYAVEFNECETPAPYRGDTFQSSVLCFVPCFNSSPPRYYTTDTNGNGSQDMFDETVLGVDENRNGFLDQPEASLNPSPPFIDLYFGPNTSADFATPIALTGYLQPGDLIQFSTDPTLYRLNKLSQRPAWYRAELSSEYDQTLSNTAWPANSKPYVFDPNSPLPEQSPTIPPNDFTSKSLSSFPASTFTFGGVSNTAIVPVPYTIFRQPQISPSSGTSLGGEYVVDLRWSGIGNSLIRGYVNPQYSTGLLPNNPEFTAADLSVAILFDSVGRPSHLVVYAPQSAYPVLTFPITEPLFFLVGRADRVANPPKPKQYTDTETGRGCNWEYPDSRWVAIDREGRVVVAEPSPVTSVNTATSPGAACLESRGFVRQALRGFE